MNITYIFYKRKYSVFLAKNGDVFMIVIEY